MVIIDQKTLKWKIYVIFSYRMGRSEVYFRAERPYAKITLYGGFSMWEIDCAPKPQNASLTLY
jgi:hypothetical protein